MKKDEGRLRLQGLLATCEIPLDGSRYALVEGADLALDEVIAAVAQTGKKGSLKIELVFERGGSDAVEVTASLTRKIPVGTARALVAFLGRDHKLYQESQEQQALEFPREAGKG